MLDLKQAKKVITPRPYSQVVSPLAKIRRLNAYVNVLGRMIVQPFISNLLFALKVTSGEEIDCILLSFPEGRDDRRLAECCGVLRAGRQDAA